MDMFENQKEEVQRLKVDPARKDEKQYEEGGVIKMDRKPEQEIPQRAHPEKKQSLQPSSLASRFPEFIEKKNLKLQSKFFYDREKNFLFI